MRRTIHLITTVTLALLGGLLVSVPVAAAADDPVVTWPEVTRFNPDLTDYTITTSDPGGEGELVAWWGTYGQALPHEGSTVLEFAYDEAQPVIVTRCPSGYTRMSDCVEVSRSESLMAFTKMKINQVNAPDDTVGVGDQHSAIFYWPAVVDAEASWILVRTSTGETHGEGTAQLPAGTEVSGGRSLPFSIPEDVPGGRYRLEVQLASSSADFGPLTSEWVRSESFVVDRTAPQLTVEQEYSTIYPVYDSYRDELELSVQVSEQVNATFQVSGPTGAVVYRKQSPASGTSTWTWDGLNEARKPVSEGTYELTLDATDRYGNSSQWRGEVAVSHKSLRMVTVKDTISAARSQTGKPYVGSCSTLAKPARGEPKGSLGFYSQTKCHKSGNPATVATYHGVYLPKAFNGRYSWVRVTLHGGPASRSSRNYIVHGYLKPGTEEIVGRKVFRKGDGAHQGSRTGAIFDRKKERPYVIWFNGLTAGSRYDVRSYTIEVRRQVLR